MMCLPGSPLGERKPSEIHREIAGDNLVFYQGSFNLEGVAEAEFERDVRDWIRASMYSYSGSSPRLPEFEGLDVGNLSREELLSFARQMVCVRRGSGLRERMVNPAELPGWVSETDIDFYAGEFERTGFTGPLNYYRCMDLNWELLAPYEGKPIQVPGLFLTGERDVTRIWGRESIDKFSESVPDLRGQIIIKDCGHWVQEERPNETNAALLAFLNGLSQD
jgi:pimeloyl-ACP methyl ester carboxylesterase